MKTFLRPGFYQKLIIGLLLFTQLGLAIYLLVRLSTYSEQSQLAFYIILSSIFVLNVAISSYIISSKSPDSYRLAWLWVVNCIPLLGAITYIVFANKQTSKRKRKMVNRYIRPLEKEESEPKALEELKNKYPTYVPLSNYLFFTKGGGIFSDTSISYYPLGDFVLEPLLRELSLAKHYIFIEFFIIEKEGYFWKQIHKILVDKVKEGVDVRVIYDDVGSLSVAPFHFDKELQKEGIKCHKFNPLRPFLDIRQNNRDHRKLVIIDGHTAFTGGFNVADEYINKKERFGHWKDNGIMIKGKAVTSFTMMFLSNYVFYFDPKEQIDKKYYSSSTYISEIGGYPKGNGLIQPYCDLPFDSKAVGERVYLDIIQRAKKYVYMTTPYLIIDSEMENSLIAAASSGIEVILLMPHIPDKNAIFQLSRSYYGNLLKAGVKIYEYTPGFVHEKMFISDDVVATVGTINLDYRSLYLHLENGTFIVGSNSINDMKRDFLDSIKLSTQIDLSTFYRWHKKNKCYWGLLRIAAPFL